MDLTESGSGWDTHRLLTNLNNSSESESLTQIRVEISMVLKIETVRSGNVLLNPMVFYILLLLPRRSQSLPRAQLAANCPDVASYTGKTRVTPSTSIACTEIVDSLFKDISGASYGGAISVASGGKRLYVNTSTFHVTSAASDGGAIAHGGTDILLSQNCFRSTTAPELGTAVDIYSTQVGVKAVLDCSFLTCTSTNTGALGTICDEITGRARSFESLNFTDCTLSTSPSSGNGAGLYGSGTSGSWTLSYSTLLRCRGVDCVDSGLVVAGGEVTFCNFYDNTVKSASFAVLYAYSAGFVVAGCLFSGTATGADIMMRTATGLPKCEVTDCWFSGAKPSSSYLSVDLGNVANAVTRSLAFTYFKAESCPAEWPRASPSRTLLLPISTGTAPFTGRQIPPRGGSFLLITPFLLLLLDRDRW
jgi:hypothetical protein